jgi:integrase/recombinase XerD
MARPPSFAVVQNILPFETSDLDAALISLWKDSPTLAFERWRRTRGASNKWSFAERSIVQHCSMFRQFLAALDVANTNLLSAESLTIEKFLLDLRGVVPLHRRPALAQSALMLGGTPGVVIPPTTPASNITVRRYVQLLAETYSYLASTGLRRGNPMIPLLKIYGKPEAPPIISYLTAGQEQALIKLIADMPKETWKQERDTTILAVLLGSGLALSELVALKIRDVHVDDYEPGIEVAATGLTHAHVAPIAPFAIEHVTHWLSRRQLEPIQGDVLFPGTAVGKNYDTSRVYELVSKALEIVESNGQHRGPATLRNTFARRQLFYGADSAQVQKWMGLATDRTIVKLLRTLPGSVTSKVV